MVIEFNIYALSVTIIAKQLHGRGKEALPAIVLVTPVIDIFPFPGFRVARPSFYSFAASQNPTGSPNVHLS